MKQNKLTAKRTRKAVKRKKKKVMRDRKKVEEKREVSQLRGSGLFRMNRHVARKMYDGLKNGGMSDPRFQVLNSDDEKDGNS